MLVIRQMMVAGNCAAHPSLFRLQVLNIVAGAAEVHYSRFITFSVMGGALWAAGMTLAGYFLGNSIPNVDRCFLLIVAIVILVSAMPAIVHLWKECRGEAAGLALAPPGLLSRER